MLEVQFTHVPKLLKGLNDIAAYLRVSRRTAWRWIEDYDFPAMKSPAGTYMTTTSLVDLWILAVWNTQRGIKPKETPNSFIER